MSRQLDATSATVADISLIKSDLDEARDRKKKIEDQVKTSNFTQQLRDKAREGKELEEQRDALHAELAGLNTQANTRAKLQLRRYEKKRKEEAMHSLIDKNAGSFRRLLKSDPRADSMEAEVSAVIECVIPGSAASIFVPNAENLPSRRTHSREVDFAERAAKDAARELQNVESSVDFSRKRVRDLTEKSQGEIALWRFQVDPSVPLTVSTIRSRARPHCRSFEGHGRRGPIFQGSSVRGGERA